MTITAIILAHFKEREANLKKMVDDLLAGIVKPDIIIMFIDNPKIQFKDERITILRSPHQFLPVIRFALGVICDTDYCFFIDDDLSVKSKTLENFVKYAEELPNAILGLEGSILGETDTPYSDDICLNRGCYSQPTEVDIIIRTYFVPTKALIAGLNLRLIHPQLPRQSLDDVFLCLGYALLNQGKIFVIPAEEKANLIELSEGGVGQSRQGQHYQNRNTVCRFLMDQYGR